MKKQATVDFKRFVVKNYQDDFGAWFKKAKIEEICFDQLRKQIPEEYVNEFVQAMVDYGFTK